MLYITWENMINNKAFLAVLLSPYTGSAQNWQYTRQDFSSYVGSSHKQDAAFCKEMKNVRVSDSVIYPFRDYLV